MTDYAPRGGQDQNTFFTTSQFATPQYSNGNGMQYYYSNNGQVQYPTMNGSYSTYSNSNYIPSHHVTSSSVYLPQTSPMSMPYQLLPPARPTMPPSRALSYPYHTGTLATQRSAPHRPPRMSLASELSLNPMADIEDQHSYNEDSMLSEPMVPALEGYPDVNEFDDLMRRYVADLSPKKQDKALIHSRRAANIRAVLIDKKTTTVESAQFRFWVKKMFTLLPNDPSISDKRKKICHEGKPVAVREKLFKILTRAHKSCQHGGRDKTSAQVRRVYSWVPKELISRFVKLCPTCKVRRGQNRLSPPASEKSPEEYENSPETCSPASRRDSMATKRSSVSVNSPLHIQGSSSLFAHQNRWMAPAPAPPQDVKMSDSYQTTSPGNYVSHETMSPTSMTPSSSSLSRSDYNINFSGVSGNSMYSQSTSSGFPSSHVRSTNHWHRAPPGYTVKQEGHYDTEMKY